MGISAADKATISSGNKPFKAGIIRPAGIFQFETVKLIT